MGAGGGEGGGGVLMDFGQPFQCQVSGERMVPCCGVDLMWSLNGQAIYMV